MAMASLVLPHLEASRLEITLGGLLLLLLLLCGAVGSADGAADQEGQVQLDVGYYDESCPSVEDIVRALVQDAVAHNAGLAPGLLRLHFHDCFVQGCDASVLLDSVPDSGTVAEKDHPINIRSLRGMDVIDNIKDRLEQECPRTVSCADILAFAARDAVDLMGGPSWPVPSGRLDGYISLAEEVEANLPSPTFNLNQLTKAFTAKGLSQEDMITLSGAHTIGDAHCMSFQDRLFKFNATHSQDPNFDVRLAATLQNRCAKPSNGEQDIVVGMDFASPRRFDVNYYVGLQHGRGLFSSDVALLSNSFTSNIVSKHVNNQDFWFDKFADSMFRLSQISVKTNDDTNGPSGEIRINCHCINY